MMRNTLIRALVLTVSSVAFLHAALITYSDATAFDANVTGSTIYDFESFPVKDMSLFQVVTSDFVVTSPLNNLFVSSPGYTNYGVPVTTSSILTANGDEDFLLTLNTPSYTLGFDTYLNAYGPASIEVFGTSGSLGLFSQAHAVNQVGFFGLASNTELLTGFRWTTTNGRIINTGIDNVRFGGTAAVVPEPASMALLGLGLGLLGLMAFGRRNR